MSFQLQSLQSPFFKNAGIDGEELARRIDKLSAVDARRWRRLWGYYRNPMIDVGAPEQNSDRPYRQAQEWGLPTRITGVRSSGEMQAGALVPGVARKEVVIENDIAWRVDTMIDYLFGQRIVIDSTAPDPDRRQTLGKLLRLVLAANGGIALLQRIALMGAVYGFVDILVKFDPSTAGASVVDSTIPAPSPATAQAPCATQNLGEPAQNSAAARRGPVSDRSHRRAHESVGPCSARRVDAHHSPDEPAASDSRSPDDASDSTDASPPDAGSAPTDQPIRSDATPSLDDASQPASGTCPDEALLQRIARQIRVEVVEPARALPLLCPTNYLAVEAYVQISNLETMKQPQEAAPPLHGGWWGRFLRRTDGKFASHRASRARKDTRQIVEILTPTRWQHYENEQLVASGNNSLGKLPLVHIQNTAVPFEYSGFSDVEPLIPLQDELNTRLSDRAHRITMQSFKMYLGKGIDNFNEMPVAPGRMWATDNDQADVIEFGGDAHSPSEESHIGEIREALDKTSGVTPIAAGAIKGRIGRLTSAAALRVTMQALLAKTEKKRSTYGAGIAQVCTLALEWLDRAGLFVTSAEERNIEINWPHPIPANEMEKLQEAEIKSRLGIPHEIVLRELGY